MSNIRTDLASELREENGVTEEDGIKEENIETDGIKVKRIEILDDSAAKKIGRNKGKYISIYFDGIFSDNSFFDKTCEVIKNELNALSDFKDKETLVIGLGNAALTADALGPKTVSGIIASRHLKKHVPKLFYNMKLGEVSTLTTSVLGKTGIESSELVKAAIEKVKPKIVIVIDALAAREMKKLCTTLQITDTGICPGSGVGNNREELSEKTLGVKVISIGVPTVVNARTLAHDLAKENNCEASEKSLSPYDENLIVTPKDIDILLSKCASLLSTSINKTLHPYLSNDEINLLSE